MQSARGAFALDKQGFHAPNFTCWEGKACFYIQGQGALHVRPIGALSVDDPFSLGSLPTYNPPLDDAKTGNGNCILSSSTDICPHSDVFGCR